MWKPSLDPPTRLNESKFQGIMEQYKDIVTQNTEDKIVHQVISEFSLFTHLFLTSLSEILITNIETVNNHFHLIHPLD